MSTNKCGDLSHQRGEDQPVGTGGGAAAEKGEDAVITRYGKPVARISGITKPKKRVLGFDRVAITSDYMEPTDPQIVETFYK